MQHYPTLCEGIELQEAGPETLVHDPHSRRIHVLNEQAAAILRACDGQRSVDELAALLGTAEPERAAADTRALLEQFSELGLVR